MAGWCKSLRSRQQRSSLAPGGCGAILVLHDDAGGLGVYRGYASLLHAGCKFEMRGREKTTEGHRLRAKPTVSSVLNRRRRGRFPVSFTMLMPQDDGFRGVDAAGKSASEGRRGLSLFFGCAKARPPNSCCGRSPREQADTDTGTSSRRHVPTYLGSHWICLCSWSNEDVKIRRQTKTYRQAD